MARAHDDAREGEETTPDEPSMEDTKAVLVGLVKLDAALRAGSPSLSKEPGAALVGALEELLERHTMHRKA